MTGVKFDSLSEAPTVNQIMKTCPRCGKEFAQLGAHLKRKVPCSPSTAVAVAPPDQIEHVPVDEATIPSLAAISLFSGAGGDTQGIERAGYTVVAFNEFNEAAIKTHTTMFPSSKFLTDPVTGKPDIKKVPNSVFAPYTNKVGIVFAGFPCQGFSHAGKKQHDDKRNELVHEFARVASVVQPEWIIGENVKGLLARKGRDPDLPASAPLRPVIDIIKDLFDRTGYKVTYKLIDVTEIGVPQHRKRLILVGHRGTQYPHMPWDALEPASTPPQSTVRSFLEPHLEGAMELPALYNPAAQPPHYWIPTTATAATGAPHPNLERLVRGIRNLSSKEQAANPTLPSPIVEPAGLISFGVRKSGYHGMIVNPDAACNTIISTYNLCPRLFVGLYNPVTTKYWIRCMTPRELGQIQGFPADYAWQGTHKEQIAQIGNAVPPPLAERIVRSLARVEFKATPQHVDSEAGDEDEED